MLEFTDIIIKILSTSIFIIIIFFFISFILFKCDESMKKEIFYYFKEKISEEDIEAFKTSTNFTYEQILNSQAVQKSLIKFVDNEEININKKNK